MTNKQDLIAVAVALRVLYRSPGSLAKIVRRQDEILQRQAVRTNLVKRFDVRRVTVVMPDDTAETEDE